MCHSCFILIGNLTAQVLGNTEKQVLAKLQEVILSKLLYLVGALYLISEATRLDCEGVNDAKVPKNA